MPAADDPRQVAEALYRVESPKVIAKLLRLVQNVSVAEELAQETFVQAIEHWTQTGIPSNPAAWLMTVARNRALDLVRHRKQLSQKHEQYEHAQRASVPPDFDEASDDIIRDDLLRLLFVACHPVLSREARVALTLRLLGGLQTHEIARAFLMPEATIAQRITRAKRTLSASGVDFELPSPNDVVVRLDSVLEVIYLIFNEGYLASSGEDYLRPALVDEALRLGRVLSELSPEQAEVHGLLALMAFQASRLRARTGLNGAAVLLMDQDRSLWDKGLVACGQAGLSRASVISGGAPGPYELQAAIAACHARATEASQTDFRRILELYDELAKIAPSPVVELNRAVATGMAHGPSAALEIIEPLLEDPRLSDYPYLPSVHAEFLSKLGRFAEAKAEVERAATLTHNAQERALLVARAVAYANAQTATVESKVK